jgi:hypothetical protein
LLLGAEELLDHRITRDRRSEFTLLDGNKRLRSGPCVIPLKF